MKLKRILRDASVLIGFCGAFSALLYFAGGIEADSEPDITEFSQDRVRADRSLGRKDWDAARINLERMLAKDPLDGRAQFAYANSFYKERAVVRVQLDELESPDSEEYRALTAKLAELDRRTAEELNKSRQHARYRGRSLMYLAVLEAELGNLEASIDYLNQFVESGNYTPDGLASYRLFGTGGQAMTSPGASVRPETRLHSKPDFWEVVRIEHENRVAD